MIKPYFSIVVPSFNSEATLSRCLNSILAQTFNNYEVILADGASTDATIQIASSILGPRLVVSCQADQGIFDGMNRGISCSKGKWVLVLGSDDELFCAHTLEQAHKLLQQEAHSCRSAAYGDAFIRGSTGWAEDADTYMGKSNLPRLIRQNLCQQAVFYYGNTIRCKSLQFNHYLHGNGGDHSCNIRLWCVQPFVYLPMTVCIFYAGGTSSYRASQYSPSDLLAARFWPNDVFKWWANAWIRLRCLVAWKQPKFYRLISLMTALPARL